MTLCDARYYRYETDLARPVEAFIRTRLGPADIAHELSFGRFAPDLVVGCRAETFHLRAEGQPPVCDAMMLRLLDFLQDEGASDTELRKWAPWGWRGLRRALEPAVEAGLVYTRAGRWYADPVANPYESLIAIELKLTDWRKGLVQARRNRGFASESWLVLASDSPQEMQLTAAELGLGLLVASGTSFRKVVEAVPRPPLSPLDARFAAELVFAQTLENGQPGAQELRPLAGSPRGRKLAIAR